MTSPVEDAERAYPAVRFATFQRWVKRTGTISWVATIIAFVVVLLIMSQVTPDNFMIASSRPSSPPSPPASAPS